MTSPADASIGGSGDSGARVAPIGEGPLYRRAPRMVFRALHGRAWVGAPGRDTVGIEGSALFVWLVLDETASVGELADQIRNLWPELGQIQVAEVREAVDSLVEAQLIEAVHRPVEPANPT